MKYTVQYQRSIPYSINEVYRTVSTKYTVQYQRSIPYSINKVYSTVPTKYSVQYQWSIPYSTNEVYRTVPMKYTVQYQRSIPYSTNEVYRTVPTRTVTTKCTVQNPRCIPYCINKVYRIVLPEYTIPYLNSTPQGPTAIPPRHGQFQLISPLGRIRPGGPSSSTFSRDTCTTTNQSINQFDRSIDPLARGWCVEPWIQIKKDDLLHVLSYSSFFI